MNENDPEFIGEKRAKPKLFSLDCKVHCNKKKEGETKGIAKIFNFSRFVFKVDVVDCNGLS